jgi:hypothetical protein
MVVAFADGAYLGAQASTQSVPSGATRTRLSILFQAIDKIRIGHANSRLAIPLVARVIVSIILHTKETSPICVLPPSTQNLAQFTALIAAIECLATDFPALCLLYSDGIKRY